MIQNLRFINTKDTESPFETIISNQSFTNNNVISQTKKTVSITQQEENESLDTIEKRK